VPEVFKELLETLLPTEEPLPTMGAFEATLQRMEDGLSAAKLRDPSLALAGDLPSTRDALRRAFRQRAKETHPDCPGGSHDAFLEMKARFDAALGEMERATPLPVRRWSPSPPVVASSARAYA
jgi:hypothetical protein